VVPVVVMVIRVKFMAVLDTLEISVTLICGLFTVKPTQQS
jgi:hypothetical protein